MNQKLNDKIIIHNYTDLSDYEVLLYIGAVINHGKLSKTSQGEQYCFITMFKNNIIVSSGRKNNTYTFYIEKENNEDVKSKREDSIT